MTPAQLRHAKRVHAKVKSSRTLVAVLIEPRCVDGQTVRSMLRALRPALLLRAVLVELGHLESSDLS